MLDFIMTTQPNDETCGATCLHSIYHYYGLNISLDRVIAEVERSRSGGTLGAYLGCHALKQGFKCTIYVNNVRFFDPTWFKNSGAPQELLISKLKAQCKFKHAKDFVQVSKAFENYLSLGGEVRFKTIDLNTFKEYFKKNIPILTGLSATYLYRSARECYTSDGVSYYDDLQGQPCGHFVVLCGYSDKRSHIHIADPYRENPFTHDNYYHVSIQRTINAIMMGALTYDAVMLMIYR